MRHLTWRGCVSVLYYAARNFIVAPAPDSDRCFMGAPIGPEVRCPRAAIPGTLWCRHHAAR